MALIVKNKTYNMPDMPPCGLVDCRVVPQRVVEREKMPHPRALIMRE